MCGRKQPETELAGGKPDPDGKEFAQTPRRTSSGGVSILLPALTASDRRALANERGSSSDRWLSFFLRHLKNVRPNHRSARKSKRKFWRAHKTGLLPLKILQFLV